MRRTTEGICVSANAISTDMNYKPGASSNRRRLRGWDYSKGASFFITISTEPRRQLFGKIVDGKMRLSKLGEESRATLERMPMYSPEISLFGHVVMPDHVHFNVHLAVGLDEPLKRLGQAIRSFKNHTTKVWKGLPRLAMPLARFYRFNRALYRLQPSEVGVDVWQR